MKSPADSGKMKQDFFFEANPAIRYNLYCGCLRASGNHNKGFSLLSGLEYSYSFQECSNNTIKFLRNFQFIIHKQIENRNQNRF